ncbi:unnamed protein product, partial [Thlaspi arvense]
RSSCKMDRSNNELDKELLHSQAHIWNHIFNFINSMSIKCAVQLGIPDIVKKHGRPMTLSQIVAALPINPSKGRNQKVSENDEEEGYLLTPTSRLLLKDEPLNVTPFLLAMLDPVLTMPWHHVSEWFQNDDATPFDTTHGRTFWDYASHEPRLNKFFNEAMASDARWSLVWLLGTVKDLNSLVDVGGGIGVVAKSIANAYPHLKCTVLDLPHVVAGLEGSKNLNYAGGDMFEAIPPLMLFC